MKLKRKKENKIIPYVGVPFFQNYFPNEKQKEGNMERKDEGLESV